LRIVIAVLLDLVLLALAYLQIRPARKPESTGLTMRSSGAVAEVSVESARERILKAVSEVSDVVSVEARVVPIRGRADLDLDVEVLGEEVRLPDKQREINRALKQVINKQLGLQLAGRPRVHIRLRGEKPLVMTPPPRIEPLAPIPPVPAVEPPPERKESAGVFGGMRRPSEYEETIVVDTETEKSEEKESGGLFSGLFRSREREDEVSAPAVVSAKPVEAADEEDLFSESPELSALLRSSKGSDSPPAAVVAAPDSEDEGKTLILDVDKEKTASNTEDQADEPKPEDADERKPGSDTSVDESR
jgi:hypothetical protein